MSLASCGQGRWGFAGASAAGTEGAGTGTVAVFAGGGAGEAGVRAGCGAGSGVATGAGAAAGTWGKEGEVCLSAGLGTGGGASAFFSTDEVWGAWTEIGCDFAGAGVAALCLGDTTTAVMPSKSKRTNGKGFCMARTCFQRGRFGNGEKRRIRAVARFLPVDCSFFQILGCNTRMLVVNIPPGSIRCTRGGIGRRARFRI